MTFSPSPAWGTEQERTRDLQHLSGAEVRAAQLISYKRVLLEGNINILNGGPQLSGSRFSKSGNTGGKGGGMAGGAQ